MRMLIALLTIAGMQVSANGFSQKINLKEKNISLEKVFSAIGKQTSYSFFYDYELLKKAAPVTLDVKNAEVEKVLNLVLAEQPFEYSIEDNIIVIRKKTVVKTAVLPEVEILLPPVEIAGHVYNDAGEPLSGAIILLKGTKKAALTNAKGEFTMQLVGNEATEGTLVFSYVGFHKREYKISGHKSVDITLERNVQDLSDYVITNAYSKPKRKEEVTGSISTVTAQQLQVNRPIESFDKMLEGLAAGVQVIPNTELGTPVKINIRGQNSLSNLFGSGRAELTTSSQPLFIVDGVPVIEQRRGDESDAFLGGEALLNPLAGVNPDDIESISVLKDASAAAIYGANASNGVIIITTKKGKAGKTRLNAGYSTGLSQSINKIKWLDGYQYHELLKETYVNDNRSPLDAEQLSGAPDINTPWFELVNQYGTFQNADINLTGGSENTQFRISGSYLQQQSIQKGNDYQNVNFRMRLDHTLSKKLLMTVSLAPTIINKNALNTYTAVPIAPNVPAYNADGTFYKLSSLGVPNPLAILAQNTNKSSGGTLNSYIRMEYQPFKNLRVSSNFGIDALINKINLFNSPKNATGENSNGSATIYDRTNFSWISSTQANWTQLLGRSHKIDITAGFEATSQQTKLLRGQASGFSYSRLIELGSGTNNSSASSKQTASSYSIYGQALYNYKEKYYASFSGRYDAASIFGTDVNATINSAIGLGWIINKEKFLANADWLSTLRLRASYGTTGNSRIGSYEARGLYTFSDESYNDVVSANITTAPNPDLTWEKNYKTNLGLDIGIGGRFNIAIDAYQNIVDDAISAISTPVENGFNTLLANIAKMRNRGFDLSFNAQVISAGDFTWNSTINWGYNKNVVLEVKNNTARYASQTQFAAILRSQVSTSAIWGFEFAGVEPTTGKEQYYDNTGKIVTADQLTRTLPNAYKIGDRLPDAQGGFINNFRYKSLSLAVNLLYSFGADILINYENENNGRNLSNRNQSVNLLDRWQKPGDITYIPKLGSGVSGTGNPIVSNSSRYVYSDTYLKLSNVTLSYTLPAKITQRLKGANITVYANGTNLLYWYKDKSPEGRNGVREYKFDFPEAQTFTGGIRLSI